MKKCSQVVNLSGAVQVRLGSTKKNCWHIYCDRGQPNHYVCCILKARE